VSDPFRLDGDVALVTGGGTGIGLGIGRCLAACGARVVLAGRHEDALADAVRDIGHDAVAVRLDVTDRPALPAAVEAIEHDVGPIAALVNNAGNHIKVPALEHSDEDFDAVVDVHLGGGFALTRAVGRRMVGRGRGSIVFLSSMNAHIGMPEVPAYSAAKAGITGLVNALSVEWAASGVRVNAVAPGFIDAGIAQRVLGADRARRERVLARVPVGRLGTAEDIGWATAYLCSPAAAYVTGVILPVDGGALIGF
jgi:NAD(P)-dependent dehydrogenase (short-subunit alcohol dehydrogenase family)